MTICTAVAVSVSASAQGGITEEMLSAIREGYRDTPEEKALRNAISANDINKLAVSQRIESEYDFHFSDMVESRGITDQKSSGRCWLFSGMNVLRAEMIAKYGLGDFSFSQGYIFFWDQLEKANLFLQGIIDTRELGMDDRKVEWLFRHTIGDGGQFTGVSDLITKYGIVPSNVMPETYSGNNTARMSMLLDLKLKEFGLELREMEGPRKELPAMLEKRKTEMLALIYRFLVLNVNYYDYASLMGTEFGMDKRERILTGASGSSHAMTLMAVDIDRDGRPRKWMVENSWGDSGHNGHLVMTDEWFEEYMFRLVAEKKYVPENILKLLDTKPVMLPPWDPMFADEH